MKYYFCGIICLFFFTITQAQIVGKVTDPSGEPLAFVNIYLEDSYNGTTSNDDGNYELSVSEKKEYTLVFQYLGFKTLTKKVNVKSFPKVLNVIMDEEVASLETVVISSSEDPAYRIIRATIAQRKENLEKISEFKADFYSKGLWRVEDVPEKIMGQEVGDFDGMLDSTRTGIIYLSETISRIQFKKPDNFSEKIVASKVSGNDNGFSFNSAQQANFSFYENTVDLYSAIVSPIANNAMNYYRYKLDGIFYEGGKLINKIQVIPRRPNDRVFSGVLYIVEDDWQLYGVELKTTGNAIQVPFISELVFKQNFKFDTENNFWVKLSQTIDFGFGFFGVKGDGNYIAVYSNYDFAPEFTKKSFTNEVLSFEAEANKKDSIFWGGSRPVPLTNEELDDYIKKDSISTLRHSKPFLDSLDQASNRMGMLDPLLGYTYSKSYDKWRVSYTGPVAGINFNTVQGYNTNAGIGYYGWEDDNQTKWLRANVNATYGLAEDRLRFTGSVMKSFNFKDKLRLSLSGGSMTQQFNSSEPISNLINMVSTLFFERNYQKLYELNYARAGYSQEVFNGLHLYTTVAYENRKPILNNTNYVLIPNSDVSYTSNDPLQPNNFNSAAIIDHSILKSQVTARITFGQKYFSNPDMKFNIGNAKFPELTLTYENGSSASESQYDYSQVRASLYQSIQVANKGQFYYRLKGGAFIAGDGISFVDFQHFNGNQTRVGTSVNYTNTFNLLPYYSLSTNKSYFEGHIEHDFRGWILGKIPGINQLNFNLVAGAHILNTEGNTPYTEYSIGIDNLGIGKYRLLRIDYVRSHFNGRNDGAFIFGLKFLDLFGL